MDIKEFKAWLEGAEELQPDDWVPNADQWKLIRQKIGEIEVPAQQMMPQYNGPPTNTIQATVVPNGPPEPPIILEGPPPHARRPSALDNVPPAQPSRAASPPAAPRLTPGGNLKTPDLDTSNGEYNSGFE